MRHSSPLMTLGTYAKAVTADKRIAQDAIAALFMFSWPILAATVFLYWMTTGLGISMGYHRLHTHRSYKIPLGLEYFFAVCGALTEAIVVRRLIPIVAAA